METIEINGKSYLIDIEKAIEQGLLKEKDNRPRSWKEYSDKYEEKIGHYTNASDIDTDAQCRACRCYDSFNSEDEAEAFCALGKLIQLRDAWWGDWRPSSVYGENECSIFMQGKIIVLSPTCNNHTLTFPNQKTADDFYETFKELINAAKMFL